MLPCTRISSYLSSCSAQGNVCCVPPFRGKELVRLRAMPTTRRNLGPEPEAPSRVCSSAGTRGAIMPRTRGSAGAARSGAERMRRIDVSSAEDRVWRWWFFPGRGCRRQRCAGHGRSAMTTATRSARIARSGRASAHLRGMLHFPAALIQLPRHLTRGLDPIGANLSGGTISPLSCPRKSL